MESEIYEIWPFGYDAPIKVKLPTIEEFEKYVNSSKSDEDKAVHFLYNVILLDKLKRYPTAKELVGVFFKSNISHNSKFEVADFLFNGSYMNGIFVRELGKIFNKAKNKDSGLRSEFIETVLDKLDSLTEKFDTLFTNFDFVKREVVQWLIQNNAKPADYISSIFKTKNDWMDTSIQNGILDYCYKNANSLGHEFVINIFEKAIRTNMREIRLVAFKYAYALTKDSAYLKLMKKDPSSYIRNRADKIILQRGATSQETAGQPR